MTHTEHTGDQHTGTNIEMHITSFYELRPDLKIRWFSVTQLGLQETWRSKIFFVAHF